MSTNTHVAVILAAGEGTRMGSPLPKVVHRAAGRPLLAWVLDAVAETRPARVMVVVGHQAEKVVEVLPAGVETCVQHERLGTGHAAATALAALGPLAPQTPVMVLSGDMPLIPASLLRRLLRSLVEERADLAMVTAVVDDRRGFGRVVRDVDGSVVGVVEERDATDEIKAIREVNAGIYLVPAGPLAEDLKRLRPDNAQGEYYLTDVVGLTVERGGRVAAVEAAEEEVVGVNTPAQLAEADVLLRGRNPGL